MFLNTPDMKACPSGNAEKATFVRVNDPAPHLEKTGTTNLYDYIQSFTESTDYTTILRGMVKGDPVASARATQMLTERPDPQWGNQTERPDLREVGHAIFDAKVTYDKLGGVAKLGMSFQDFLSSVRIAQGNPVAVKPAAETHAAASAVEKGGDAQ